MPESNKRWLIVETTGGAVDKILVNSLSFDGGSLICFSDVNMKHVKAAYSPTGWAHCRWEGDDGQNH